MKKMSILLTSLLALSVLQVHAGTSVSVKDEWVTIANGSNTLSYNLSNGLYYIKDAGGNKVFDYACFQLGGRQSKEKDAVHTHTVEDVNDGLGKGKCLTIRAAFDDYADILWQVTMYDESSFIVFNMGVDNDTDREYRLMAFHPVVSRNVYNGEDTQVQYKVLDGLGGGARTQVTNRDFSKSFNNILVRFGDNTAPKILIAGGLTYNEFEKFVSVIRHKDKLTVDLFADDPVGKGVAAGTTYLPDERFYLCLNSDNPFEGLEQYGQVLKKAQKIKLNYYDFPTECLWYASFYNNEKDRPKFNDTKGAVEEMRRAVKSGITKYTRVAIRLVPDAYSANNQQGWWDDKHWGMYGDGMSTVGPHYTEPYLTTKSWAGEITGMGGIPITYFQGARRSEDYAKEFPGHMLFNDSYRIMNQPERLKTHVEPSEEYGQSTIMGYGYFGHYWFDRMLWGYDFTDPDFIGHMREVYKNLSDAGIAGVMYDYPDLTAWAYEGGFEDESATTAYAYRNMYKLAYEGLGDDCYLDERNLLRGSDITLGLVASQRVWADTDGITPEMVTRCGLRWYKNRTVVNYDMDAKDPTDALPAENSDGNRSMLTMTYVTSGRFLLGRSFGQLTEEEIYDMGRTFPYHTTPQSARPLDAFTKTDDFCRVYDFTVNNDWHQLTFYNTDIEKEATLSVSVGGSLNEGGMALDPDASYHVYDFWNDRYAGIVEGRGTISQELRRGEARMLSVRKKLDVPQYLSTDRHIMQGYIDMKSCEWDSAEKSLKGRSLIVGGEDYTVVIATNGMTPGKAETSKGKVRLEPVEGRADILKLILSSPDSGEIDWKLSFTQ